MAQLGEHCLTGDVVDAIVEVVRVDETVDVVEAASVVCNAVLVATVPFASCRH
jgi:hypothetical protein